MNQELFNEMGLQVDSLIRSYQEQINYNVEVLKGLYFWQFNKRRDLIDRNERLVIRQQILKIINTFVMIFFQ